VATKQQHADENLKIPNSPNPEKHFTHFQLHQERNYSSARKEILLSSKQTT
jgi:hypothetical protein